MNSFLLALTIGEMLQSDFREFISCVAHKGNVMFSTNMSMLLKGLLVLHLFFIYMFSVYLIAFHFAQPDCLFLKNFNLQEC